MSLPPIEEFTPEQRKAYPNWVATNFSGVTGLSFLHLSEVSKLLSYVERERFFLEIGSANGATTAAVLSACPDATAICVDPYKHPLTADYFAVGEVRCANWVQNSQRVGGRMTLWTGEFADILSMPGMAAGTKLVFLDASHEYEDVCCDLLTLSAMFQCSPHVTDTHVLLHDYGVTGWPGVAKAVDRFIRPSLTGSPLFELVDVTVALAALRLCRSTKRLPFELSAFGLASKRVGFDGRTLLDYAVLPPGNYDQSRRSIVNRKECTDAVLVEAAAADSAGPGTGSDPVHGPETATV